MKPIVMLVMAALGAIFAYQTYWLMGLYGTLEEKIRSDVQEAVRLSDYEEMMHRIKLLRQRDDVQHGRMDVTVDMAVTDGLLEKGSDILDLVLMNNVLCMKRGGIETTKLSNY